MFLHVTTNIPGRKDDGLLRKVGGRGFPTLVAMSSDGEVLARPRRRSVSAILDAMEEAAELEGEIEAAAKTGDGDSPALAMELLRRWKMGALVSPDKDRADYIASRDKLTADQRKGIEQALITAELMKGQQDAMSAPLGSEKSDRAMLAMLVAKQKLGGAWPDSAMMNRPLVTLMRWAAHRKDPQLYAVLLEDFTKMRRKHYQQQRNNEGFIQSKKDELDRLWNRKPPVIQRRTSGGRR